ncbi:MAG: carboxymuconolactone decarboxylase family protein [Oceanipulchritudo sp.]
MAKIEPVNVEEANDRQKELLQAVKGKMGNVPNILGTMVHAPSVLKSYLAMSEAMGESSLSPALRERLSLAISEKNGCGYCLAAHTVLGKMNGLSEKETIEARQGKAGDARDEAALTFALRVMETNGYVSDEDREAARDAGLGEQQQIEIVGMIALNTLTNLFNHVAETDLDFPQAPAG